MYTLTIKPRAESDLRRLSQPICMRIFNKLERLCEICDDYPHKALKGRHRGKFRLSVAKDYRILYTFDRHIREIVVHRIGHRSSIY
ncbi:type II toxin-antitoxin system RelE/ParE family toxin [Candidatus Poribacteria bacterium]|nr:type II toxin-antitoxin system RelE/ParE family toxin [Candidatus Poribacteria bacterium]MYB00899.1 type II toxin-antitoxin system RelE/ParE family toxin [Candidatus Poribacteria bacterium]